MAERTPGQKRKASDHRASLTNYAQKLRTEFDARDFSQYDDAMGVRDADAAFIEKVVSAAESGQPIWARRVA